MQVKAYAAQSAITPLALSTIDRRAVEKALAAARAAP